MGVIKKILYRGEPLGQPRHKNLFLDMEENIHIHYRDLRIELSRAEFEEITSIFQKQSAELLAVIKEKNYQDGKLPNANQDDVRIWTESRLKHEVKYHPQRFSLEECGDGYHFHYRNYKLLIDPGDFREIVNLFRTLEIDAPYAQTRDSVLQLLHDNDIDFMMDGGNVAGEVLAIAVAQHHLPKVRDICKYIGLVQESKGEDCIYCGPSVKLIAKPDRRFSSLDYKRMRGVASTEGLINYLAANSAQMKAVDINHVKCQVLDLYYALISGKALNVDLDPQMWLIAPLSNQVIFPYSAKLEQGKARGELLYRTWANLLSRFQLGFIKPEKHIFSKSSQLALKTKVEHALRQEVAAFAGVQRIYTMGSWGRADMGRYAAPFVHGKLAKLGSDVDILVEMDPARESDVPAHWTLHQLEASNHCAVYHATEIPVDGDFAQWFAQYPNIPFTHHLIDVYVHFPSHGYVEEKDAFLKKFSAKIFYDRDQDGMVIHEGEEERIAQQLQKYYEMPQVSVEKMKVSTENALYKVFTKTHDYVLKLFKAAGNYSNSRVREHVQYEERLINQLGQRGVKTALVISPISVGEVTIEGSPALLFERIHGVINQRPEYPLDRVCAALANIHNAQLTQPLDLPHTFAFDDLCMIWLPQFSKYQNRLELGDEVAALFVRLVPLVDKFNPGPYREIMNGSSTFIHLHGDVAPKNVMISNTGPSEFFDFNNAYFGPRIVDVIDGAFEFSLAEKYIHLADFSRFSAFINHYAAHSPLTTRECARLKDWVELIGLIKFLKEIRVLLEQPNVGLRRKRALAIAHHMLDGFIA